MVVGCFSTALLTAATLYGLPVARVGTELVLSRLRPFENSNRLPATLVDALVPDLGTLGPPGTATAGPAELARAAELSRVVGYLMQPRLHPELRPEASAWLRAHWRAVL